MHKRKRPADPVETAGWRVDKWALAVGVSKAKAYELLADGTVEAVKVGGLTIVVTSPAAYLASCPRYRPGGRLNGNVLQATLR